MRVRSRGGQARSAASAPTRARAIWHGQLARLIAPPRTSLSLRYMPVVSPSSWEAAERNDGLSNVKVATPVLPSRERVSETSGTHGSGTPTMNSI